MATASSSTTIIDHLKQRISLAQTLLDKASLFKFRDHIRGMQRIEKQIKSEMAMLEKLISGSQIIKEHHLNSTNLLHLEGVLHICENISGVIAVERFFKYTDRSRVVQTVMVDIICGNGSMWVKVFARKRKALHKKWLGECNYGDKSVIDFAEEYLKAGQENPYNFNTPSFVFVFFDGITESIAAELQEMSIKVVGPIYPNDSMEDAPSPLQIAAMFKHSLSVTAEPIILPKDNPENECSLINLDISSMLAWISSLTHSTSGTSNYNDRVLFEQAQQELHDPLWPKLQRATEGKTLLVCKTALKDFKSIVAVVGGPTEQERAKELLSRIQVVEDNPSDRAQKLHCSGKVKERAKIIFGTGDTLKAVTLTANEGFVRAASGRGVHFNTIIHPCRALAELEYRQSNDTIVSSKRERQCSSEQETEKTENMIDKTEDKTDNTGAGICNSRDMMVSVENDHLFHQK